MLNQLLSATANEEKFTLKEQYEILKLQLEVESLRKKSWQKLSFWAIMLPTIISAGTLIVLCKNGVFDTKTKMLELKKENLAYEVNMFENRKKELIVENENLQTRLHSNQYLLDSVRKDQLAKQQLIKRWKLSYEQVVQLMKMEGDLRKAEEEFFGINSRTKKQDSAAKAMAAADCCNISQNDPDDIWSNATNTIETNKKSAARQ